MDAVLSLIDENSAVFTARGRAARLDLGSAAVNEQFDTRDETGVIRRQK